jgi:phospho-2-dehydro-3-deoxyheptonate aldolase
MSIRACSKARAPSCSQLAELGLAAGTEALDPISPQYLGDLISWTAIGARTTESQTHREISSGLSTPVGFKNGTNGDVGIAVNAILSASRPHSFLGINGQGRTSIVRTRGNRYGHLVLRGGDGRPNYDTVSVQMAEQALRQGRIADQYRDRLLARQQLQEARPGSRWSWPTWSIRSASATSRWSE